MKLEAVIDTIQVSIELPCEIFSALRLTPADFVRAMRLAAAVKWYETGRLSQSLAAETAGLSRSEFISALNQFSVSPFQYTTAEIISEVVRSR